jgi:pantothenate kinase-related protein Tda10
MAKFQWDRRLMVHDWPECGPGELSLDDLYEEFKKRMELERHLEGCMIHDGLDCSCSVGKPE